MIRSVNGLDTSQVENKGNKRISSYSEGPMRSVNFEDELKKATKPKEFQKETRQELDVSNEIRNKDTNVSVNTNQNKVEGGFQSIPSGLEAIFKKASQKYNVPLNLLKAVAKQESNFQKTAVSKSGAQGIMQLMPATAKALGVTDAFDPEQNIMGGAKFLSQMLEKYDGDISLALAAYNAGPGSVDKYNGIPPYKETIDYVKKVTSYMNQSISIPEQEAVIQNANAEEKTDKLSVSKYKITYEEWLALVKKMEYNQKVFASS